MSKKFKAKKPIKLTKRIIRKVLAQSVVVDAVASLSKDENRQIGAVILGPDFESRSTGFNGFPRGVNDKKKKRKIDPLKFKWTAHAEENAITQAARSGISVRGCFLIVTGRHPCATCARMSIQAGIVAVFCKPPEFDHHRWGLDEKVAHKMFKEAGVAVHYYESENTLRT